MNTKKIYSKKLYPERCYRCGKVRMVRKNRLGLSKLCRQCAYVVNAFRINSYIKRPPRGADGRFCKVVKQ